MLALSIRQPYAELILRGVKTIEYRTVRTLKIGERFYIYVPKKVADAGTSRARQEAGTHPANTLIPLPHGRGSLEALPIGVIVGSAVISKCIRGEMYYEWHLKDVKRYKRPRKLPRGVQPQPVWFQPFKTAA